MLKDTIEIIIRDQQFLLLKEKAAYWTDRNLLLIADVHAGKATHFRNNGIPLSTDHLRQDLLIIEALIKRTGAKKLCFLGDLFHSTANEENELIEKWIEKLAIETELVIGNHDLYSYQKTNIKATPAYEMDEILLSHEPVTSTYFNICGHLHPAYRLAGKGRNHIKLPSFYLNESTLILPAFGSVNGGRMYTNLTQKCKAILATDEGLMEIN